MFLWKNPSFSRPKILVFYKNHSTDNGFLHQAVYSDIWQVVHSTARVTEMIKCSDYMFFFDKRWFCSKVTQGHDSCIYGRAEMQKVWFCFCANCLFFLRFLFLSKMPKTLFWKVFGKGTNKTKGKDTLFKCFVSPSKKALLFVHRHLRFFVHYL